MNKKFWTIIKISAIAAILGMALFMAACEEDPTPIDTRPMLALTFDDGPHRQFTNRILDVLEEHDAKATFYVLGRFIVSEAATIMRILDLGSEVAGHSLNHPSLAWVDHPLNTIPQSEAVIRDQLQRTSDRLVGFAKYNPPNPHFRPPYGAVNQMVLDIAKERGYAAIGWTYDTNDWVEERRDAQIIFNDIMANAEPNGVILLHDIWETTAAAMELVIPELVKTYRLVTITELLQAHYPGALAPGAVFGTLIGVPEDYPLIFP